MVPVFELESDLQEPSGGVQPVQFNEPGRVKNVLSQETFLGPSFNFECSMFHTLIIPLMPIGTAKTLEELPSKSRVHNIT